jgi:hypothetical protein
MANTKPTRGPWEVGHFEGKDISWVFGQEFELNRKKQVAVTTQTPRGQIGLLLCVIGHSDDPRNEANARLMASAPDLLAACKAAIEIIADLDSDETGQVFGQILKAIQRAEPDFAVAETQQ